MQNGAGTQTIAADTIERLRRLEGSIPPAELSEIWVFPPLDDVEKSDEFHLFTRQVGDGVYRVCAAEFTEGAETRVTVYGAVPESRVPRIVANFRRRLGERREPLHLPIFGSEERWRLAVGADPELLRPAGPLDSMEAAAGSSLPQVEEVLVV